MNLTATIQEAVKFNRTIIGYRRTLRFIKLNSPKLIVIAKNIPEKIRKEVEHNAKLSDVKIEIFNGTSKELGLICGKQFPIAALAIKG